MATAGRNFTAVRSEAVSDRSGFLFCHLQLAVAMMCVGAALAGLTDLTYSLPGYFWAMVIPNRTMTDYSLST